MISYIASILGFQGQLNSTNTDDTRGTPGSAPSDYVSCQHYGWTVPDSAVRLRLSDDNNRTVRIFGYPPQEEFPKSMWYSRGDFGRKGPYIHYLISESPAMINYIMGDDWRSQLRSDHQPRPRDLLRDREVILRPSCTRNDTTNHSQTAFNNDVDFQAEERAHSLRMRRCGAVAICAEDDTYEWDSGLMNKAPSCFFGWPKDGGVWILRPSWSMPPPDSPPVGRKTYEEIMAEKWKEVERDQFYSDLALEVQRQDDMEDVCRVLEGAGAQFFAKIEDCPEAVERNLC